MWNSIQNFKYVPKYGVSWWIKWLFFHFLEQFSWFCSHFHLVTRLYIMAGLAESSLPKSQVALPLLHSFFSSLPPSLLSWNQIRFSYYISPRQDLNPSCAGDTSLALSAALSIWALNLTWGEKWGIQCVWVWSLKVLKTSGNLWKLLN